MLEPYSEGTVNVVAGSDTITGNNTYWARQIRAGDKISVDHDVWYIVTSVNSDTDIKIDAAYLGATAQAKAYIIARDSAQWGMNAAISADVASLMKTYKLGLQAPIDQVAEMKQEVTVLKDEAVEAKTDAQTARQTAVSAAGTSTQAKDAAIDAKNEAVAAKTAAEVAKTGAETAKSGAEAAKGAAETAKNDAVAAKGAAENAKTSAETAAISSANSQDAAATSASVSADSSAASESAKNDAVAAKGAAENAKTAAIAAKDAAVSAKTTAVTAKDAAVTAKTAAETARDIATTKASEAAASAANAANSAAAAAQSAADAAANVPAATETVAGKIAIATVEEVETGTEATKAVTPTTLKKGAANGVASLDSAGKIPTAQMPFSAPSDASTTIKGVVQLATLAEVNTGTDAVKVVTPETLKKGSAGGVASLDANSRMPQNLTAPTETYLALGSISGTKAISGANANVQSMTIVANTTITLTAGASASECRVLTLIITNGGAYTVTWPASVKWVGGSAPTFSAAGVDVVTLLTVNGGVTWLGSANGVSYA